MARFLFRGLAQGVDKGAAHPILFFQPNHADLVQRVADVAMVAEHQNLRQALAPAASPYHARGGDNEIWILQHMDNGRFALIAANNLSFIGTRRCMPVDVEVSRLRQSALRGQARFHLDLIETPDRQGLALGSCGLDRADLDLLVRKIFQFKFARANRRGADEDERPLAEPPLRRVCCRILFHEFIPPLAWQKACPSGIHGNGNIRHIFPCDASDNPR